MIMKVIKKTDLTNPQSSWNRFFCSKGTCIYESSAVLK